MEESYVSSHEDELECNEDPTSQEGYEYEDYNPEDLSGEALEESDNHRSIVFPLPMSQEAQGYPSMRTPSRGRGRGSTRGLQQPPRNHSNPRGGGTSRGQGTPRSPFGGETSCGGVTSSMQYGGRPTLLSKNIYIFPQGALVVDDRGWKIPMLKTWDTGALGHVACSIPVNAR
jgi:hypothetical protein